MSDERSNLVGQTVPITVGVADAQYCFPAATQQSRSAPLALRLLCAGRERCLPSYHVERMDFNCRLIEFVVNSLLKNAVLAFFNLAKLRAQLLAARKTATFRRCLCDRVPAIRQPVE